MNLSWASIVLFPLLALAAGSQNFVDIKPTPQQVAWQDLEIGVLVHFGPNSFMDREWGDGKAPPSVFDPTELDAEQWVLAAKSAGARYLILVAKHHDGFCLWPTKHADYSVKSSPWRHGHGDLVEDVAKACRKHGFKFGVYLSPWDRHEPSYVDNAAYDDFYVNQLRELATNYGELVEFWLDGAGSEGHVYDFERYVETLRTYQPNTLIFAGVGFLPWGDIRWVGNEDGFALADNWNVVDRHGYLRWRPVEADTPLRVHNWFWHTNAEDRLRSLSELLDIYHQSVGHGAQLVLGLAPDNRGLIPDVDVTRLEEFGNAIRRIYGNNLALGRGTPPEIFDGDPDTYSDSPRDHTLAVFDGPKTFDRTVTMEWLNNGQHIQKYRIEAQIGGEWKVLHTGTSIGHKKIDILPRTTATAVRLNVLWTTSKAAIREFQVYDGSR